MRITSTAFPILIIVGMSACLDPYLPPPGLAKAHYLVVQGFLYDSATPTVIRLSRTASLDSNNEPIPERNAFVEIEDNSGGTIVLTEGDAGAYSTPIVTINPQLTYRLRIRTAAGQEYASDFVPFKTTPPIDSIGRGVDGNYVDIYANAHDDNNATHYYFWKFEETWQYNSAFFSAFKFENKKVVLRDPLDVFFTCWKTQLSTNILVGSSVKLDRDIISNFVVATLPLNSGKLQSQYSILLSQFAITKDAFDYWDQLKKNTENIGTIFGPQPSQGISNIRGITNPNEPVVGYFSACSREQKRTFIYSYQLPPIRKITGYEGCTQDSLFNYDIPIYNGAELLTSEISVGQPPLVIGYFKSSKACVDCRFHGGTTLKPDFWK